MRHFLAYGNSDQASFRDEAVRTCFDYMTVPGTIAAYYEDATAAFVLSSQLNYVIDPRTPLFQGAIPRPRASHFALASWLSPTVEGLLGEGDDAVRFDPAIYSDALISEMVANVVSAQRTYGERSGGIVDKMARYQRLLAQALNEDVQALQDIRPPSFVLAPYFVVDSRDDDWWDCTEAIWNACLALPDPESVCPVIAGMSVAVVSDLLQARPQGLAETTFMWISGFEERRRSVAGLRELRALVEEFGESPVVNMYGGFFSIALGAVGLWGVNNGLGYSESRAWPELPATGAAPARYYVPRLHTYFPPRLAQLIMDASRNYWCECPVCEDRVAGDYISIVDLSYHDLKKHFALSRAHEIEMVSTHTRNDLAQHLQEESDRFDIEVAPQLPVRLRPDVSYLIRWSTALQ